jgi:hypothetical protein
MTIDEFSKALLCSYLDGNFTGLSKREAKDLLNFYGYPMSRINKITPAMRRKFREDLDKVEDHWTAVRDQIATLDVANEG